MANVIFQSGDIQQASEHYEKAIQLAELGNIVNDPEISKVVSEELGGTWKSDK